MGSPPVSLVTRPFDVQIANLHSIETVKLYEPFSVEYRIKNLTGRVVQTKVEF